jgi:microcystin-dependent protein
MSEPFLGQIATFGFNFAPNGWALCNGQTLPINQNTALFSLIGTTFGGNGTTTFQLPNLQGNVAIGSSGDYVLGQAEGEANHTLVINEMAGHNHGVVASSQTANQTAAPGNFPGAATANNYSTAAPNTTLGSGTAGTGGSQPHNNMQPYLVINFCIALVGIFPTRN